MNKLKIMAILSKIVAHTTWAAAGLFRLFKNAGKKTVDIFKSDGRFDVEIFKGNEQIDKRTDLTQKQLLDVINTLEVFPSLSIIVNSSDGKGEPVIINV